MKSVARLGRGSELGIQLRAVSIRQPWASLIASGIKTIETRSWSTTHRGDLLICAARRSSSAREPTDLPTGVAIAVVRLVEVRPMRTEDSDQANVRHQNGLWAWVLSDARAIQPFPVKGQLRLFDVADEKIALIPPTASGDGKAELAGAGQRLMY